ENGIRVDDVTEDGRSIAERTAGLPFLILVAPQPCETVLAQAVRRTLRVLVQRRLLRPCQVVPQKLDACARAGYGTVAGIDRSRRVLRDQIGRVPRDSAERAVGLEAVRQQLARPVVAAEPGLVDQRLG